MEERPPIPPSPPPSHWKTIVRNTAYILVALLIFLFALDLLLSALQHLGQAAAETIILATSNPFTALFIGLLATAILQSSTATTSMTVALVASGSLTLQSAIPIVMGANIGTTITSTIVSLGFLSKKKEFRRAVSAGTYHDFFNILTAAVLFPLEHYFQFLSWLASSIANEFFHQPLGLQETNFNPLGGGLSRLTDWIAQSVDNGFLLLALSAVFLFGSILFFRKVLTDLLGLGVPDRFRHFFFQVAWKSFGWGVLTTAAIRSSTVTTSLVVPLVAKKVVKLKDAVPFILGANIGTTLSAFLAAVMNSNIAISIAIAHFLFNFIGVVLFYLLPGTREIPVLMATGLGRLTMRYRSIGFAYLLVTFFLIPFSLIYFNRDAVQVTELTYQHTSGGKTTFSTVISRTYENPYLSSWSEYAGERASEPARIYSVYHRNNLLIINNELFELNRPGFCRNGEDNSGKYTLCIREIIPSLQLTERLTVDSVFVFEKRYDHDPGAGIRSYIGAREYFLVKREVLDTAGSVQSTDALVSIIRK
ncbi:MAG: Na/Pi symporter [Cyclobacteriaceae bacterium]|nr:Na/Pi symporter [Cyclobacteriaceae bacterium]